MTYICIPTEKNYVRVYIVYTPPPHIYQKTSYINKYVVKKQQIKIKIKQYLTNMGELCIIIYS